MDLDAPSTAQSESPLPDSAAPEAAEAVAGVEEEGGSGEGEAVEVTFVGQGGTGEAVEAGEEVEASDGEAFGGVSEVEVEVEVNSGEGEGEFDGKDGGGEQPSEVLADEIDMDAEPSEVVQRLEAMVEEEEEEKERQASSPARQDSLSVELIIDTSPHDPIPPPRYSNFYSDSNRPFDSSPYTAPRPSHHRQNPSTSFIPYQRLPPSSTRYAPPPRSSHIRNLARHALLRPSTPPPPSHKLFFYAVPLASANLGSLLIGPSGKITKRLQKCSGVAELRVAFPDDHEGGEGQAETRLQLLGTSASIARALSAVEYLVYSELWPSPYLSDLERELLRNRTWVGFEEEQLVEKEGWWVLNQFSEDAWALVGRAAVRDEEGIRATERRRRGIYSELGTAAGGGREDDRFAPHRTQQRNWNERGGNRGESRWAPQGRDEGWGARENRDRWNGGDEPRYGSTSHRRFSPSSYYSQRHYHRASSPPPPRHSSHRHSGSDRFRSRSSRHPHHDRDVSSRNGHDERGSSTSANGTHFEKRAEEPARKGKAYCIDIPSSAAPQFHPSSPSLLFIQSQHTCSLSLSLSSNSSPSSSSTVELIIDFSEGGDGAGGYDALQDVLDDVERIVGAVETERGGKAGAARAVNLSHVRRSSNSADSLPDLSYSASSARPSSDSPPLRRESPSDVRRNSRRDDDDRKSRRRSRDEDGVRERKRGEGMEEDWERGRRADERERGEWDGGWDREGRRKGKRRQERHDLDSGDEEERNERHHHHRHRRSRRSRSRSRSPPSRSHRRSPSPPSRRHRNNDRKTHHRSSRHRHRSHSHSRSRSPRPESSRQQRRRSPSPSPRLLSTVSTERYDGGKEAVYGRGRVGYETGDEEGQGWRGYGGKREEREGKEERGWTGWR